MTGIFTVIMDTFYRPALLREAVEALFRQTYGDLEIILVNNGATPETVDYLYQVEREDRRVKLVHFAENQFSLDDPLKMVDTCLNAALSIATGDFVFYQSDDDLIADDYAEKMVALFRENDACTTAAGLPVGIDINGKRLDDPASRSTNFRPRHMPGHDLALEVANGNRRVFSAPGTIFSIRRDVLVRSGGFHRCVDWSHLFGIVPFGITGFDESALLYWRRHDGQLNLQLTTRGFIGAKESFDLIRSWKIGHYWEQQYGGVAARSVVDYMVGSICKSAANWFAINLVHFRVRGAWRILRQAWHLHGFWCRVPSQIAIRSRQRIINIIRPIVPAPLRQAIKALARRGQKAA